MTKPTYVYLEVPKIGGKCWVLDQKGIFVLETGPGTLRTIACTHAGSGSISAYDGVPNEDGEFPDLRMPAMITEGEGDEAVQRPNPKYPTRNGRRMYPGNPAVMGSWMLDGGFHNGLTIVAIGGHDATPTQASIVWMPFKQRQREPLA